MNQGYFSPRKFVGLKGNMYSIERKFKAGIEIMKKDISLALYRLLQVYYQMFNVVIKLFCPM